MLAVIQAVSSDLLRWEKVPEDAFYAPADKYEPDDWRDPFVFWNEDAGQNWMLLAACAKEDPAMRKGCKALCLSADLQVNRAFGVPSLLMFVAVCGLRFAVCGLRFAVCGLRFAVCGLRIEKLHLYRYFSAEQRMR